MMDKRKMLVTGGIIIAVIIGIALGVYILPKWNAEKPNSVVYLATGEIYIGKLSIFPKLKLDDTYLLQIVKDKEDPAKNNFQLTPLTEALWSPKTLYLNFDQVVFYGPINDGSKAAEAIRSAKK